MRVGQLAGLGMGGLVKEAAGAEAADWVRNGWVVEAGSCCG